MPGLLQQGAKMNIGKAIREEREHQGFTQLELAIKTGYTEMWILQIEKKKLIFQLEPVYTIADALDIPLSQLFARAEQVESQAAKG